MAFMASGTLQKLSIISLEEYAYLIEHKDKVPDFLDACEKLNQIPEADQHIETLLSEIPSDISELLYNLKTHFKRNIRISEITTKHTTAGWFKKIFGKAPKEEYRQLLLSQLASLKFVGVVKEVARNLIIEKENVTIDNLLFGIDRIRFAHPCEGTRHCWLRTGHCRGIKTMASVTSMKHSENTVKQTIW